MFVKVFADLHCEWEGLPPTYRIYVNNEMIAERDFKWIEPVYLTEIIQIDIPEDEVTWIEVKSVGPQLSKFRLDNYRVNYCDHHVRLIDGSRKRFGVKILDTVNPKKIQHASH
jgi:hypothetical protein